MKFVEAYTDGACSGNPGRGGWGVILKFSSVKREIYGMSKGDTTNNRMELTAVIEALSALKEPCSVKLTTDSKYVTEAINQGWLESWQRNAWRKKSKKPVLNVDLWRTLIDLLNIHDVEFIWIKGHDGNPYNERCDELAKKLIKNPF